MEENIQLETKFVGDISGEFFVPSYQRGYRWGKDEVEKLLNDIYSTKGDSYWLQPIVLRKNADKYDLVDGQQRLTTLYLIYKYMHKASNGFINEPRFSISYETRNASKEFLDNPENEDKKDENIDFWFMSNAYKYIHQWFDGFKEKKTTALTNMNKYFDEKVKVIWYEVDCINSSEEEAIKQFERLNIGKIPLTNSELVKSLFLSSVGEDEIGVQKQEEIALQWDNIEKELHNESLWHFITNKENNSTRIDFVLDIIAQTPEKNHEKYFTFFYFDGMRKNGESLKDVWKNIQQTFLCLKGWYEHNDLYHKIGYLIASNTLTMQNIYNISKDKTKKEFENALDVEIRNSVKQPKGVSYHELSYEKNYDLITKLLLLFNIESIRQKRISRFPFDEYKKGKWTLEHIHAQHSKRLKTEAEWREWIEDHKQVLMKEDGEKSKEFVEKIEHFTSGKHITEQIFNEIHEDVVKLLSEETNVDYEHSLSNMALLKGSDNSSLNNSLFAVKRDKIIEMDKRGNYIPFCTRNVFLKYYTKSSETRIDFSFWKQIDRQEYIKAINDILYNDSVKYIEEPIESINQELENE